MFEIWDELDQWTAPTKNQETMAGYIKLIKARWRCFSSERGREMSVQEFVAELIGRKRDGEYAQSTWRRYKAAAIYYLVVHAGHAEDAIEALMEENSAGLKTRSHKTSGAKLKHFPASVLRKILVCATKRAARNNMYSELLKDYFLSTLLTGLRPSEWAGASISLHLETGRQILIVENCKNSNGRANGPFREIFIDNLSDDEISRLRRLIDAHRNLTERELIRLGDGLESELRGIKKELISRRPDGECAQEVRRITLYSARHQFAADAKSTFPDPVLVSALLGHNSTRTAFTHYGKRARGSRRVLVEPTPETVLAVQNVRREIYDSRLKQKNGLSEPAVSKEMKLDFDF
jgi:hypothetical protein